VRFFVYDPSDLLQNIPVTKSYDAPTAQTVLNFAVREIRDADFFSYNGYSTTVEGDEIVDIDGSLETLTDNTRGWVTENVPIIELDQTENVPTVGLNTGGKKHFTRNRHTVVHVLEWLTDEIGGAWYFVPEDDGVRLVVNNGTENTDGVASSSYYDGNFEPPEYDYLEGFNHASIDVLQNSSLEDLKPINYLELLGESADSFLGVNTENFIEGFFGAPTGHTDKYPYVQIEYPPLLERTGDLRVGPRRVESGKGTLGEARQEAINKFKEAHEDSTSGSIVLRGTPPIRPYDYMSAVPVCNDTYDADMDPIQYEVNTVVHHSDPAEHYTTELGVSMLVIESEIDVVTDEYREFVDEDAEVEITEDE